MKIRIKDRAEFRSDKMAKVALATTSRTQLDLYCLGPGQEQKPHAHADQDKIYLVLEGFALVVVDGKEERLEPGEAVVARAGQEHGLRHAGTARLMARPVRASLMITCLGDMFFPEVGVKIVRLLRRLGVTVEFPAAQTCCGLPLFNSAYHDEAAAVATRTIPLFKDAEHVVVPSGSCAWMVKREYPGLMHDPVLKADAERLAARTFELSQFLVK